MPCVCISNSTFRLRQNNIDILICIACTNHDVSPRIYCSRLNPFSVFGKCVKEEISMP